MKERDQPERPQGQPVVHNTASGVDHSNVIQLGPVHGGVAFNFHLHAQPASRGRPDDVPAARAGFVDRVDEQHVVGRSLGEDPAGPVRRVIVSGLAGVGKRELVRQVARVAGGRFDGCLYVDYGSRAGGADGDPARALAQCLSALGQAPVFMPGDVASRIGELRRLSRGLRLLVVVENATTPAQISMVTPTGPGSAIVATSTSLLPELNGTGTLRLRLRPLPEDAALELLASLCDQPEQVSADPDAALRVIALCGALPVALHIVAARLMLNPHLTLADIAKELAEEPTCLPAMTVATEEGELSVSEPFDLAYQSLTPDQARVYRSLGLLPGSFDSGVMAAALSATVASVQPHLDQLVRLSLLEPGADGRYHVHELVRRHAGQRAQLDATADERDRAVDRVITHYLALTALADRAVVPVRLRIADLGDLLREAADPFRRGGKEIALAWLEAERRNILAVLQVAVHRERFREAWQLAEAFTVLFLHHRHVEDWRDSLILGVDAAVRDKHQAAEARLRSMLSRPLLDLEDDDRAAVELEIAVGLARQSPNLLLRASVQEFRGRYWARHDKVRAVAVFEQALVLNRQAEDRRGTALAGFFLGTALDAVGRCADAVEMLDWAYTELADLEDRRMAARTQAARGRARGGQGDLAGASEDIEAAIAVLRDEDARHYEADAHLALADLLEPEGSDTAAVCDHLTAALEIFTAGGSARAAEVEERLRIFKERRLEEYRDRPEAT